MKKILTFAAALLIAASGAAFAQKQDAPKPAAAPVTAPAAKGDAKPVAAPASEAKKDLLDVNSATEKELAGLPKIGEARAKAIVKGRPYNGKDDLINKKIIPQDAYDAIKDSIIAKQPKKDEAKKPEMKKEEKKK